MTEGTVKSRAHKAISEHRQWRNRRIEHCYVLLITNSPVRTPSHSFGNRPNEHNYAFAVCYSESRSTLFELDN